MTMLDWKMVRGVCAVALGMGAVNVAVADGSNSDNVFSDAAVWIKGAYDKDSTLGVDATAMRHALNASIWVTGANQYGAVANRYRNYEDVVCPYAGTVMSNVPCFYLPQTVLEDGTVNPASFLVSGSGGRVSVTDCVASVVMRIRPEDPIVKSYWVFGKMGFNFGFDKPADKPGKLRMMARCNGTGLYVDNFYVDPGTWMDVAVVSYDSGLAFYAVTNNGTFWSQKKAWSLSSGVLSSASLGFYDAGSSGAVATNGTSTRLQSFRGSIQSFAIWNRRLSEAEVREAFAFPRTDVMRIGLANGSGGEFIKASPDGAPVNADDWYGMPAALAPGESVDIAFWQRSLDCSLPQVLRLSALSGTSTGASLSVSVNGVVQGKPIEAVAGKTNTLFIPGNLFHDGSNTLHLANNSSGTVKFDALALGGSWQMGVQDDNSAEFSTSIIRQGYAEDCSLNPYPYKTVNMHTTNSVVAKISAELAESGHPAMFCVRALLPGEMSYYDANATERPRWKLLVNGIVKGEGQFSTRYQTLTAKLRPGDLVAGTNVFAIANENATERNANAWFHTDFWRLELKDLPKGLAISFR